MKIVIDTNVIMSAIFFEGKPKAVTDLVLNDQVVSFANDQIVCEYDSKIGVIRDKVKIEPNLKYFDDFKNKIVVTKNKSNINICRDIDDNKFIECAVDNGCLYIVSDDKDLTAIKNFKEIKILSVADFLAQFSSR